MMPPDVWRILVELLGTSLLSVVIWLVRRTDTKVDKLDDRQQKMHVALVGYDGKSGIMGDVTDLQGKTNRLSDAVQRLEADVDPLRKRRR